MEHEHPDDLVAITMVGAELHLLFDRVTRRAADLTLMQFRALAALARVEPDSLEPRDLAQSLQMGSNYVTKLLDQLEEQALVERRAHQRDRRRRLVTLTPAGRERLQQAAPHVVDLERWILDGALSPDELEQLRAMIRKLRRFLGDAVIPMIRPRPGP